MLRLCLLLWSVVQAQLIATPSFVHAASTTTISLGIRISFSELSLASCSLISLSNASDFININTSVLSGELICFAPPGRNGSQLLLLNLTALGRGIQSTLIVYYDDVAMSIAPGGPATYRSTGGNNLRLVPVKCDQLCSSTGSVLHVQIAANTSSLPRVSMQAVLSEETNGSYVYEALVPYEIGQLENVTGALMVLVSYDGQHYQDSGARIVLRKTAPLRVGFGLYATVEDFGWSYSCNQARLTISEKYGRSMETVSFARLERSRDSFLSILNTSNPFDLWIHCSGIDYELNRDIAKLVPQTQILTTSGDAEIYARTGHEEAELSDNFNTCWGMLEEARYLAGIVAGGFALSQGLNEIGYVAAFRIPEVFLGLTAFTLGARLALPNVTVRVRFIDNFFDPYAERLCAEQFLSEGIRIIAQHTDSKASQLAAQRAGGWAIGSNSNIERALFGDFVLTTPYMIWSNTFLPFVENAYNDIRKGATRACGLDQNCVGLARLSPLVPDELQIRVREVQQQVRSSSTDIILCGELKDNNGNIRVPVGQCMNRTAKAEVDWFLDSVMDLGDYIAPLPEEEKRFVRDFLFAIVCALMALMLIVVIVLLVLVIVKRETTVMRAASWKFLIIILVAVMLSLCAVPLLGLDESRANLEQLNHACQTLPWLITLSMLFAFGSLFGKTWRLFHLFDSKAGNLHRTSIKDTTLFGFVVGTAIPGIVICGVWTGALPLGWARVVESRDEFEHATVSHGQCESSIVPPALLAAYFILLLLVGNYLAFVTRNLPTSFTESRWIAQVLSSVFQCLILYIPLDLLISGASTEALFLLRAFSLMIIDGMLVGFIFAPKLLLMIKYNARQLEELQSKSVTSYIRESSNAISLPAEPGTPRNVVETDTDGL